MKEGPPNFEEPPKEPELIPKFTITEIRGEGIRVLEARNRTTDAISRKRFTRPLQFDYYTTVLKELYGALGPGEHEASKVPLRIETKKRAIIRPLAQIYDAAVVLNHALPDEAFHSTLDFDPEKNALSGKISFAELTFQKKYVWPEIPQPSPPQPVLEKPREQEPLPENLSEFDHIIISVGENHFYLDLDPTLPESFLAARALHRLALRVTDLSQPIDMTNFPTAVLRSMPKAEKELLGINTKKEKEVKAAKDKILDVIISLARKKLYITNDLNQIIDRPRITVHEDPPEPSSVATLGVIFSPGTDKSKIRDDAVREPPDPKRVEDARVALNAMADPSLLTEETAHGIAHNMITLVMTKDGKHALAEALAERSAQLTVAQVRERFDQIARSVLEPTGAYQGAVDTYTISGGRVVPGRPHAHTGFINFVSGEVSSRTPPSSSHILKSWVVRAGGHRPT